MPHVTTDDGVTLYYEEAGRGVPVVFVHEFAGDWRSWEPQMRHFSRYYRCITYSARGYLPSDVPAEPAHYSQARARDDVKAILDGIGIERAHVVGLSMGGFATLHFGFTYPERALSLTIAGCGYGSEPDKRAQFAAEAEAAATRFDKLPMEEAGGIYAIGPTRVQFQTNDPRGWAEFRDQLVEHSPIGSANTLRGLQKERPSLYDLTKEMATIRSPTLILTGDEDWPCLAPAILMKRTIPSAALAVLPNAGHTINLEAPAEFNRLLQEFLHRVDVGGWRTRDPRANANSIMGGQ
ncbi:alpha/beta fold hydrolase [Acuticoccus mangrovi]|uniref:Alpha/beta fold hydrolase n=1 Tax=Acuticoccus mangrovi TaxID=2796142 RepID=A0A934ITD5_9HYPH|nr:alpha/beta hydrolase [Acuticoccus mangrovi]MBJ3778268.1 alpha/beta fold hydrolase [Acuticoccus mangrovi]